MKFYKPTFGFSSPQPVDRLKSYEYEELFTAFVSRFLKHYWICLERKIICHAGHRGVCQEEILLEKKIHWMLFNAKLPTKDPFVRWQSIWKEDVLQAGLQISICKVTYDHPAMVKLLRGTIHLVWSTFFLNQKALSSRGCEGTWQWIVADAEGGKSRDLGVLMSACLQTRALISVEDAGLYQKIGNSKNGNSVFSIKDMHCQPVLAYRVTNFLPKLVDMLFSMEKNRISIFGFPLFSGYASRPWCHTSAVCSQGRGGAFLWQS